jgi:DNA mismatch endonuclease (patch repair protein)
MARIGGRNTDPELTLQRAIWHEGLRYRLHHRTMAGRPDMVFLGPRVAVYVDGCYWHGCPEHYVAPRTGAIFWSKKLRENVNRDRRQTLALEADGWRVVRVWEHEVYTDLDGVVERMKEAVQGTKPKRPRPEWRVVSVISLDDGNDLEERHLEALRDSSLRRVERKPRSTRKW